MPITPPECKTCGKAEWRHTCLGPAPTPSTVTIVHHRAHKLSPAGRIAIAKGLLDKAAAKTKPRKRTKRKRMPKDKAAPPADGEPTKRPRGRPRTIENLKAYKAQKQRDYRKKAKAK